MQQTHKHQKLRELKGWFIGLAVVLGGVVGVRVV